jgi:CheY-like chemotaxis protein/tetratricopeptide (TPR) repeat protein
LPGNILCIDDDRNFSQILSKALTSEGYAVQTALDGDQALELLTNEPPDLVLLDLILPRRDGFAVLSALREMDSPACDTAALIITGCSPTPEYRSRARSLGALELITKPIPLSDLLELVARYTEKRKPPASVVAGSTTTPKQAVVSAAVAGTLEQLPVPALFHQLHGLRATGVLHLRSGKKRKWVELRDGYPRAIRSNLANECLGNFLVRGGRITQAALAESSRRMKPGRLQGEILVAMEILSEEQMAQALRGQADEKLFEIFGWRSGSYRFEKGAVVERANSLGLDRSPANLILRGVRGRFPLDQVEDYLRAHSDSFLAHAESPFYQFQEVDLDAEHEDLLAALDGSRRLSEFLNSGEDLKRTLYAMLSFGLLELRGGVQHSKPLLRREPRSSQPQEEAGLRSRLAAQAERVRNQSYFEILGIEPSAGVDEVRGAFEKQAVLMHPDRYSTSGLAAQHLAREVFARLNEAYETLSDPRRRGEYLLNQRKQARDAQEQLESKRALEAEKHFAQGRKLLSQRSYERALRAFGRALELYPGEGEYHAHYGWALHLFHPNEPHIAMEAIEHVRRGIKLAAHRETSYLFLGRLNKAIGRVGTAEKMFARALQVQPECVEALRELRLINMRRHKSKGLIGRLLRR